MKLQYKIWLTTVTFFVVILVGDALISRHMIQKSIQADLVQNAKDVHALLMVTRRVYQQQLIESGLPIDDHTIGLLPEHALSHISADYAGLSQSGLRFNNVTDKPRNPANKADAAELEAMAYFRAYPKATQRVVQIVGRKGERLLHYTAPIWTEPYCLKCHGERGAAPLGIATRYENAYGYKVGSLLGVVSIKLAIDPMLNHEYQDWKVRFAVRLLGYAALLILLSVLLNRLVTRRLLRIEEAVARIGEGDFDTRVALLGNDEVASLGRGIERMADALRERTQALRLSEERHRSYIDNAPEAIFVATADGRYVDVNPAASKLVGYTREELLCMSIASLKPDRVASDTYFGIISDVKRNGQIETELGLRRKDGSEVITLLKAIVLEDGRVMGFCSDLTQRRRSEEQYRAIVQASIDGFWVTDGRGQILECNDAICHMYGYSREELLHMTIFDVVANEDPGETTAHFRDMVESGYVRFEGWHKRKDGSFANVEVSVLYVANLDDRFFVFIRDISERKQAEGALRLAASVFANSYDGVAITDASNHILDVNPAFSRITGYAREEMIGLNPNVLTSGRQGPEFYACMWTSLKAHDFWQGEIWNRRKNGEVYAEMLSISVVRNDAGELQHYIGVFSDISQIKAHEIELHRIAHYDVLTGLPNRRLLADRFDQAIARARRNGKPLAVCYLDLDGFKAVNDQYGHAEGDRLLIKIAARLNAILRADDTLARLGGDEFVVLFSDLPESGECQIILERVMAAVKGGVQLEDSLVRITASVGVTLFPQDDTDADTLLRHADHAMYRAKESGKNQCHIYDPTHDRQLQAHRFQLKCLGEALENEEFVLHYQPKVDLVHGDVIGAEALIRWQHPQQGLLPPSEFLHHMAGTDLEIAVGEWVIESVLKQIAAWNAIGLHLTVSANVTAEHLLQLDFFERLCLMLEAHPEVPVNLLELEILETAALANMEQAVLVITSCRQLGVHFSLDDFGTGYSSLTYFRNLPIDTLKVDQSFVRDMLDDPEDLGIVESVVRLAQAFNRPVIAEGVETLEHGAMLIHLGCHFGQGFGIARPMPAQQFPEWVSQWRRRAAWLTMDNRVTAVEDLTLGVATQSHRNWVDKVVKYLDQPEGEVPVALDIAHCRFGRWYRGSGAARYGELAEFKAIAPLHEAVHVIATELVALARDRQAGEARARVPELYAARDQLLAQFEVIIQKLASSKRAHRLPD